MIDDIDRLSLHTKEGYNHNVKQFLEFTKIKSTDKLLMTETEKLETLMSDYCDYLNDRVKQKLISPNTVPKKFKGIKCLLDANGREHDIKWKKLSGSFPRKAKKTGYKPYTTEHIQEMFDCNRSVRSHAFIHFMASTGGRIGVFEHPLLMKHLIPMTWETQDDCYAVLLYADEAETIEEKDQRILADEQDNADYSYYGFLTPESTRFLKIYLHKRQREGEVFNPDTPIFRTLYQVNHINENVKQLSRKGSVELMSRIFHNTAIKRIKTGRRYDIQIDHGFRKRFNTILKLNSEVNSNIAEKLMSHKKGLDGTYLTPTREECFKEFVKSILELTIDSTQRQKLEIQEKEKKIQSLSKANNTIEELKQRYNEVAEQLTTIQEGLNSIKSIEITGSESEVRRTLQTIGKVRHPDRY